MLSDGRLVNVAIWIVLVFAILASLTKLYTKWTAVKKAQSDDVIMIVALLMSVGQCVAISQQVSHGLGQSDDSLSKRQLQIFYKASLVGQIFYLATVNTAKLIGFQWYICLTREDAKRRIVQACIGIVLLWTVVSILITGLQCGTAHPWDQRDGSCLNMVSFWTVAGVVDMLTQILVSFLPVYLLSDLRITRTSKRWIKYSFSPNLLTIPLCCLRLYYIYTSDFLTPQGGFNYVLLSGLHSNMAIIFACLPFLKPVVEALTSGLISNDIEVELTRQTVHTKSSSHSGLSRMGISSIQMDQGDSEVTRITGQYVKMP